MTKKFYEIYEEEISKINASNLENKGGEIVKIW